MVGRASDELSPCNNTKYISGAMAIKWVWILANIKADLRRYERTA